jgi:T-complex protein 1 subunit gamma
MSRGPVFVLNTNVKRETGRKAQLNNIKAAKTVADVIRTSLGPKAMLKMILVAHGSPLITNDGHAILRELNVAHPAAKSMLDLAKTQDEEVGDGTTSVIILAGEILAMAAPWLEKQMHPRTIIGGYNRALQDALEHLKSITRVVDTKNDVEMLKLIRSCLGTKFVSRWGDAMANFALKAVRSVFLEENGRSEVDIKHFVKIEKIAGGDIQDSCVIPGVILNKDVTHSAMRRRIVNPRIIILDCNLEYKKPGNLVVKLSSAPDFEKVMKEEEEQVKQMVMDIVKWKPDLVITEKGLSDEAQHWFLKHNVTALRRTQRSYTNRIARATGAVIVDRPDQI